MGGGGNRLSVETKKRCLYGSSWETFVPQRLSKDTVILMHGGGNWGDLWRVHQEFRLRIMEEYPENPIIVLPQSVYYEDPRICEADMALVNKHQNVTICVRDQASYDLLTAKLDNKVLLLPDMAFLGDYTASNVKTGRTLFLKRSDKELANLDKIMPHLPKEYEEHDWPTLENDYPIYRQSKAVRGIRKILRHLSKPLDNKWEDHFWEHTILPFTIKTGVDFLNQYDTIYTTRLHTAILGMLLGKEIILFDNSYGKNSGFFETWLSDVDNIKLVKV